MISDVTRQQGKYLFETREGVTEAGAALSRRLSAGSLILSNSATVCVPKILKVEGCIHDGFVSFGGLEEYVTLDFAYWWFESVRSSIIQENRQGVTQVNLNTGIVRDIHFPLVPRGEQSRIVAEIEKQFTRLDAAVAGLKRVKANLKRYRASVLKAACEGRLVPTEAELAREERRSYETGEQLLDRILKERRANWETDQLGKMCSEGNFPRDDSWKKKYKEPESPDTEGLSGLPDGWAWATLESVVDAIDPQPSHRTPPECPGGVPYIGMGDVDADGLFNRVSARKVSEVVLQEHRERYQLKRGDFFIGKIGTIGAPILVRPPFDFALSANVVLIQPVAAGVDCRFLFHWMTSPTAQALMEKGSRATTQAAFGIQRVRVLPCPIPPTSEQPRISDAVEKLLSDASAAGLTVSHKIRSADRLRQSILKRAFEGKLVPQDPNDEPASVMLERIRAKRTTVSRSSIKSPRRSVTVEV
jgi:type I restriction enzyme S subunit